MTYIVAVRNCKQHRYNQKSISVCNKSHLSWCFINILYLYMYCTSHYGHYTQ